MPTLRLLRMRLIVQLACALLVTAVATEAAAIGEVITDIRVLDNQRTQDDTIRSLAGISIGETLEADTLERVRDRLNTSGLFADVNVWWEAHREGVRVNIAVKDKFPWAPVPTASWAANNRGIGAVFVHGNLFGRGKQLLLGGRLASLDSGAVIGYRDPAFFGSWLYWQVQGHMQFQSIPEYDVSTVKPDIALRETRMFIYGLEAWAGVAWFRRIKTQVGWRIDHADVRRSLDPATGRDMTPASEDGVAGVGRANLTFDWRSREYSVMTGTAFGVGFDVAAARFGSDFDFWKLGASFEQGIRFFRRHNLIYWLGTNVGENLPFWTEITAGGQNLRGYLFQQFRGDTRVSGLIEYHFPLLSIGALDIRLLGFYDVAAIWWRSLPSLVQVAPTGEDPSLGTYYHRNTPDGRSFPTYLQPGFKLDRDLHNAVGGGIRFFLRSVAVPLVGVDAGYGLETGVWRVFVVVGA